MSLRARLENGDVVFGSFTLMVEPVWVEVLGRVGFDFVVIDCEEAGGDSYGNRLEELVRACQTTGAIPTARIIENTPGAINRGLNAGNELLYIPHVRSAETAEQAVSAARYPPLGRRGAAPMVRAAHYGLEPWDEYLTRANEDSLLIMMIEDLEGVENIEEIVQVPGVDGVLVGTWDLAVEMGCADYGPAPPQVMERVEKVIKITREAGLYSSAHGWSAEAMAEYIGMGSQIITCSIDSTLFLEGVRELEALAADLRAG